MSKTSLADVSNQVQKYWSPMFTKELREALLLGGLVNKEYEGEIRRGGDTVYVSQVNAPNGQTLTIGTDADTFATETVSTSRVTVKANKRFVAAYEFEDVVSLQSQIDQEGSPVRESLLYAMSKQINDYLYSLVSASTSSPDHYVGSVSDMNTAALSANRILAGQAKWPMSKPWYALVDPVYYADILDDTTLAGADYGAADRPIINGRVSLPRMNFNIFEDNSLAADHGLFFYEDFLHFVSQRSVQVKVSDLHAQKKFGVILSVDLIGGAALGVDGDVKHIQNYNSAWAP